MIDTSGRLHTSADLMRELEKVVTVTRKRAAMEVKVVLVIDATTGQNGLQQAREFNKALGLDGVIMTKLDGTAKGGIAVAVSHELGLPILRMGVGEGIEDLQPFDAHAYAEALFGEMRDDEPAAVADEAVDEACDDEPAAVADEAVDEVCDDEPAVADEPVETEADLEAAVEVEAVEIEAEEPTLETEPVPAAEPEPEVVVEPESEAEVAVEPEPEVEAASDAEPEAEPEPEDAAEPEPEPEPEQPKKKWWQKLF